VLILHVADGLQILGTKFPLGGSSCSREPNRLQIWYTTWVQRVASQKHLSRLNLAGIWAWTVRQKFWDPLIICSAVEASDFKFGTMPKQFSGLKLAAMWAWEHVKHVGTPNYFCSCWSYTAN